MLGALGLVTMAGVASAQPGGPAVHASSTPQMVVQIGPGGHALVRGTVGSVSASSLTVKSWGGDWTINVSSTTSVAPEGTALTDIKQGDFVGVQGTADASASWTINAKMIRDWTERGTLKSEIKLNQQTIHQTIKEGSPRNFEGTVSALSGQSFTLTADGGTPYSVTLTSNALIYQKNFLSVPFSQVQNGDNVRIWGTLSGSTISAPIFRDLSLPR